MNALVFPRPRLESREKRWLCGYGMKSGESRGRLHPEEEDPYRTAYQKDRDRIIHSKAFRRLAYKTQVHPLPQTDHVRTRLTHSLEVAQIGRTIARTLGCNEDLVEAICLAHDLGHPPFGHAGEEALSGLMAEIGGFDHQWHTYRLLTVLERRRPGQTGLNLTHEVREGILKHDPGFIEAQVIKEGILPGRGTLEAQISNLADEIAYNSSDLDDLLGSSALLGDEALSQLRELRLFDQLRTRIGARAAEGIERQDAQSRKELISEVVDLAVRDCIRTSERKLRASAVRSVRDVRAQPGNLIDYSAAWHRTNREFKDFLMHHFYQHPAVRSKTAKGIAVVNAVFDAYRRDPALLPEKVAAALRETSPVQVIGEHIASMTDRYLLKVAQSLGVRVDPLYWWN